MKTTKGYPFPFLEPSPWKPSLAPYLASHVKVQICDIECECLGIFQYEDTVTVDLYSESFPENFYGFYAQKCEINKTTCETLEAIACSPMNGGRIAEDVLKLCGLYGKKMEKGKWIQRIVLSNPVDGPVKSLSLVLFYMRMEDGAFKEFFSEFTLTEDGEIFTKELKHL